jgi:hypothetical protein
MNALKLQTKPPPLEAAVSVPALPPLEGAERERYRLFQYHFVQFFVEHLSDASRVFEGDLQEMLVLAVIGQAYMRADELGRENATINACRISETTGIPRQTVRRKLQSLQRRGWVQQIEGGAWQLTVHECEAAARIGLAELDKRGMERIQKFVRTVKDRV